MRVPDPAARQWYAREAAAQVRAGQFTPRNPAALPRTLAYLDTLEAQGRYTLMVWPVHCEVGSWGHGIHADVLAACGDWQLQRQRAVRNVFKGTNPWTEHYSAIEAEVPDADDASTALNTALLQSLGQADVLLIAGEASSHCVQSTTEHIVQHLPRLAPGWQASRIVLLKFKDRDAAKAFYASETYNHARTLREGAGVMRMVVVDGMQ